MKAVILVGGEGTRLRPLTWKIAKSMVPVLNKPFLEYILCYLRGYGIDDIVLACCFLPDFIRSHFGCGDEFRVRLSYAVEDNPLGTAGAVKNAEEHLGELFFVLNGDVFTDLNLGAMLTFHRERKAKVTIALTPVQNPTIYGLAETDEHGRVLRFVEKPSWEQVTTNMINAGIYIVEPEVLQYIPSRTPFMFEHNLFPMLLEMGLPLYGYPSQGYWIDIGTPEKYLKLNHDLLLNGYAQGFIEEPSSIDPTAKIKEPVIVGSDSNIGADVLLCGPVVMGHGCRIDEGALIEGAVLWSGVQVGRRAVLRNCVVADNCCIGDGGYVGSGLVLGHSVVLESGARIEDREVEG
jgi:mannose-1-phosphate guanylyltransferase